MSECYVCETDVFVGKLTDDNFEPAADTKFGFKDKATSGEPYGGMSVAILKTGISTEATIFSFDVGTAILTDENEGFELVLVENIVDGVVGARVAPFEEIYVDLGIHYPDFEAPLVLDVDSYGFTTEASNHLMRRFLKENYNNTPHVTLKCYVTAP